MIALIDYGAGNLGNARRALEHLSLEHRLVRHPTDLPGEGPILLPGVGNYGAAMETLHASGLDAALRSAAANGRPVVGICIGLQLLFSSSEEAPGRAGLGILPGHVRRLAVGDRTLPHLGWCAVQPSGKHYYFAHSFRVCPADRSAVVATAEWGEDFPAIVRTGAVLGFQFHPERSGAAGLSLLEDALRHGTVQP